MSLGDAADSDTLSIEDQLTKKNDELRSSIKKLQEAEEKIKQYEEAALDAYDQVDMMEEKLQNEQRCLEQAVRVASRLYSKHSQLKNRTIRQKRGALSARRKAWKKAYSNMESSELINNRESDPDLLAPNNTAEMNDNSSSSIDNDEDPESDELEEIVELDKKSQSHLDEALKTVNELQAENDSMTKKITSLEETLVTREDIITHLRSIVDEKNLELKDFKEKYEIESEVRQRAETYAAKMYGKNKAFQRKSVLMRSVKEGSFDRKVEDAMKDVEKLQEELEQEKVKRRQEVADLDERLQSALAGDEMNKLRNELEALTIEMLRLKDKKSALEDKVANLEIDIASLRATQASSPQTSIRPQTPLAPTPPPPPPVAPAPPPPPPPSSSAATGNSSVAGLIAQRKAERGDNPVSPDKIAKTRTPVDNFANAMEEMMKRIRSGAPMVRSRTNTTGLEEETSRNSSVNSDSGDSDADEQEYKQFCSRVGNRRPCPIGMSGKSSTIGYLPRKTALRDDETDMNPWKSGLKRVTPRLHSTSDTSEKGDWSAGLRKSPFRRQDGSVRHPEGINPDLRKILEKQRQRMKNTQH